MTTILFIIAIFVAIWFGSINACKVAVKDRIPYGNFIIMAMALTLVIIHVMGVW